MHALKQSQKIIIVYGILLFANAICVHYYAERYLHKGWLFAFLYLIFGYNFIKFERHINNSTFQKYLVYFGLVLFIIISVYFFQIFPKETNGNDKWSDITAFWDAFLKGENGWSAHGHLGNKISSLPLNLLLAYPFYKLGLIDYFSLFGFLAVFIFLIGKVADKPHGSIVIFYLCSPLVFMEVVGRSNLLLNGLIFLLALQHFIKVIQQPTYWGLTQNAAFMGAAMCYRMVFVVPLAMIIFYVIFQKKIRISIILVYLIVLVLVIISFFFPFVYGHFNDFIIHHPFTKQAKKTPLQTGLLLLSTPFLAKFVGHFHDLYFYTIILVFVAICLGLFQYTRYTTLLYNAIIFPMGLYYILLLRVFPENYEGK